MRMYLDFDVLKPQNDQILLHTLNVEKLGVNQTIINEHDCGDDGVFFV